MTFEKTLLEQKRYELRQRLGKRIPDELNTDFNLDRWLNNYELDLDLCEDKFIEYLANRKALGYDCPEALDGFFDRADVLGYCEMFSLSRLDKNWINEKDNGIVFVETGVPDPGKVVKSIRVGDYLSIFFGYCEYFQRMVIEHEAKSGRASHGICVFDMKFMSMINYANPMSPINKLFQYRVNIWLEYYGELLKHVVIANPPRFLGAVFKIMSLIMPDRVLNRFSFAQTIPTDMEKYISFNAIPIEYKGGKQFEAPYMENGCIYPKQLTKEDYLVEGSIWLKNQIKDVQYDQFGVNAGDSHTMEFAMKKGQQLLYEYVTNRDFELKVTRNNTDFILPKFKMVTPVLSEEGSIDIDEDCTINFDFKNISKMMKMKLKFATKVVNRSS
ncbi:CRAL-TRIO domain-containing protein [Aphelenchoides besseyi]|nr:CRAL-TRIO domain-containing protein [Aphelenchoides besseyi]